MARPEVAQTVWHSLELLVVGPAVERLVERFVVTEPLAVVMKRVLVLAAEVPVVVAVWVAAVVPVAVVVVVWVAAEVHIQAVVVQVVAAQVVVDLAVAVLAATVAVAASSYVGSKAHQFQMEAHLA